MGVDYYTCNNCHEPSCCFVSCSSCHEDVDMLCLDCLAYSKTKFYNCFYFSNRFDKYGNDDYLFICDHCLKRNNFKHVDDEDDLEKINKYRKEIDDVSKNLKRFVYEKIDDQIKEHENAIEQLKRKKLEFDKH